MTGMSERPAVLVTGAAGFVAKRVVTLLLHGGYPVVALQHRTALAANIAARCARVLSGDICDPAVQNEALRDVQAVCHVAAYLPERMDDVCEAVPCYKTNAQASLELAVAAARRGIRRFVHFSTGNMYASASEPCTEQGRLELSGRASSYFVSKLAAEIYLSQLYADTGLQTVILRVGTPYGPGEPSRKVIPTFLRLAAKQQSLRLVNGGGAKFNFVHVDDVAECAVRAVGHGPSGIYNLASGEHTSLMELAVAVMKLVGTGSVPDVEPSQPGAFCGFPGLSIAKAQSTWNFSPRSLDAGLRDYWFALKEEDRRS